MHGNMCEWCNDWYGEYNIDDKMNPKGPETGEHKSSFVVVVFGIPAWRCRSACRGGGILRETEVQGLSFRIVKDEYIIKETI